MGYMLIGVLLLVWLFREIIFATILGFVTIAVATVFIGSLFKILSDPEWLKELILRIVDKLPKF